MNLFHLRQLLAVFCALWILIFMGLSSINKRSGEISIFDLSQLKERITQTHRNLPYAEDPLEKYMLTLTNVSDESGFTVDENIETILASNASPIRLAELIK